MYIMPNFSTFFSWFRFKFFKCKFTGKKRHKMQIEMLLHNKHDFSINGLSFDIKWGEFLQNMRYNILYNFLNQFFE